MPVMISNFFCMYTVSETFIIQLRWNSLIIEFGSVLVQLIFMKTL